MFEVDMLVHVGLLGEQHKVDVGQHTIVGDGDAVKQLRELLVVASVEKKVARHDVGLLVVLGRIARQLQHLWFKEHTETRSVTTLSSTRRAGMDEIDGWLVTSAARYSRTAAR